MYTNISFHYVILNMHIDSITENQLIAAIGCNTPDFITPIEDYYIYTINLDTQDYTKRIKPDFSWRRNKEHYDIFCDLPFSFQLTTAMVGAIKQYYIRNMIKDNDDIYLIIYYTDGKYSVLLDKRETPVCFIFNKITNLFNNRMHDGRSFIEEDHYPDDTAKKDYLINRLKELKWKGEIDAHQYRSAKGQIRRGYIKRDDNPIKFLKKRIPEMEEGFYKFCHTKQHMFFYHEKSIVEITHTTFGAVHMK